ncbi:uncharacterized protein LOC135947416 [Cloeon dipterum]|uniref:uncharacterized protein LOC135947416 n=1 Tax=Cloeon dipterum TaxID=197152 RepID=UPI00321F77E6
MECHPVRLELSRYGCSSSRKIDQAFRLFLYLCEELRVWDISHDYSPDTDLIYIRAKLQKDADFDVFVPLDMNSDVTPQGLCALQSELGVESDHKPLKSIKLAFVGSDNSVIIYDMIQGVAPFVSRQKKKIDAECALAPAVWQYVKDNNEDLVGRD